jgi:hypothetical protein
MVERYSLCMKSYEKSDTGAAIRSPVYPAVATDKDGPFIRFDDYKQLESRIKVLEDALKLAKLAWYGGHLPNDWYTTITKDYENKEFQKMTIGQVVSKLAALEVKCQST